MISALRGAGVEVREQHRAVWERRHNWSVGLRQMLRVAEAEHSLRKSRDDERGADALIRAATPATSTCLRQSGSRGDGPSIFNPLGLAVRHNRSTTGSMCCRDSTTPGVDYVGPTDRTHHEKKRLSP